MLPIFFFNMDHYKFGLPVIIIIINIWRVWKVKKYSVPSYYVW